MAPHLPDPDFLARAKADLRERIGPLGAAVDRDQALQAGERVAELIAGFPEFGAARRVALYAALPDEVSSRPLFLTAQQAGKTRLLPRCTAAGGLEFLAVESWDDLVVGRYGVLEPGPGGPCLVLGPEDIAIVPGVAFSPEGDRLGRGRGYYDRTFPPGRPAPFLIGVGFRHQIVESLPCGDLDRRMDAIVTEAGIAS